MFRMIMIAGLALLTVLFDPVATSRADVSIMTRGYSYFNKAGADWAAHNADIASCIARAFEARSLAVRAGSKLDSSLASGGLVSAMIWGPPIMRGHRGTAMAALENCMVVKGWRVVKLPDREGRALARLPQDGLAAALAPWIGADTPNGQIVRAWNNEAVSNQSRRLTEMPAVTDDGQLSLQAATGANANQFETPARLPPQVAPAALATPSIPLSQLATVEPGKALILVSVRGVSAQNGMGILFRNAASIPGPSPAQNIHIGEYSPPYRAGEVRAYVVSPGLWRVAKLSGNSEQWLDFCWGAPAFEVRAGEVIWAGAFDLAGANLQPNMDLGAPRGWLSGHPGHESVFAATYLNGSTSACEGTNFYSLEFGGAGVVPGYERGLTGF